MVAKIIVAARFSKGLSLILVRGVAVALALFAAQDASPLDLKPQEVYAQYADSVCTIVAVKYDKPSALGSGFIISADGLVVTNRHVVDGAPETLIKCGSLEPVRSTSTRFIEGVDLALLETGITTIKPIVISRDDGRNLVGQTVYVIGSPAGLQSTISSGLISGVRDFKGQTFLQISAPISGGSSGGPVFLPDGEVVGVATGMMKEGQNLNFAVLASMLWFSPEVGGHRLVAAPNGKPASAGIPVQAKESESTSPAPAKDSPWASKFLSRTYWQRVKWDRVESDDVVSRLPVVRDPNSDKVAKGARRQERGGALAGEPAAVLVLDSGKPSRFRLTVNTYGDTSGIGDGSATKCKELQARVVEAFGPGRISHERAEGSAPKTFETRAQWDFGPTRVSFDCVAFEWVQTGGHMWMWSLKAGHQSVTEADSEWTWIRCTRRLTVTFQGKAQEPKDMDDEVFVIDDFAGKLYQQDLSSVSEAKVSKSSVSYTIDSEKITAEATIDRVLGRFSEIRASKHDDARGRMVGQCTKFDPKKTKF